MPTNEIKDFLKREATKKKAVRQLMKKEKKRVTTRTQSRLSSFAQDEPRLFLDDHRDKPITTPEGKAVLIITLFRNMQNSLLAKLDNIPSDWDGHELRAWIAKRWELEASGGAVAKDLRRRRKFKNDLIINNL